MILKRNPGINAVLLKAKAKAKEHEMASIEQSNSILSSEKQPQNPSAKIDIEREASVYQSLMGKSAKDWDFFTMEEMGRLNKEQLNHYISIVSH